MSCYRLKPYYLKKGWGTSVSQATYNLWDHLIQLMRKFIKVISRANKLCYNHFKLTNYPACHFAHTFSKNSEQLNNGVMLVSPSRSFLECTFKTIFFMNIQPGVISEVQGESVSLPRIIFMYKTFYSEKRTNYIFFQVP